ncbi:MAG TPA: quinone-dependent dihydroorotate dehydrogenase [Terrimicrobiaceae bacterium]|nr:quinone-dependent dihydroorotate dehydrogenase [Terrimicrobiaceae bacterium]
MNIYATILRPLLFRLDAEEAHHLVLRQLSLFPPALLRLITGSRRGGRPRRVFGCEFPNRVGLAAGMDKNALALPAWEALGFGFVEIGTITAHAQTGNPRPRLFRFPEYGALINRMGFNNDGAEAVAARLNAFRKKGKWPRIPVGINLGKSKVTPLDEAAADYLHSFRCLRQFGDYFVINVSSPNTPGLRDLQETRRLEEIIRALRSEAPEARLLVKIAPDLSEQQVLEIGTLAETEGLAGLIATNTTLDHSALPRERDQQGGLSGAPLTAQATRMLKILRGRTSLPLIASGGVMDTASAKEKFDAGAHLVQIYTGLVYRGPQLIREITLLDAESSPAQPS